MFIQRSFIIQYHYLVIACILWFSTLYHNYGTPNFPLNKVLILYCNCQTPINFLSSIVILWIGVGQPPDPHTSGNRCANKPVPRYPTRLSAKVLISRITVYSILTFLPNNRLVTTRHIPLNEAKNVEVFIQSVPGKPNPDPSRSQLTYPIPALTQIFFVLSTPNCVQLGNGSCVILS